MSFNILGNGLTGLQASQQALNVISQNIANASTPGYVRQRAVLQSQQTTPGAANVYTGHSEQFMGVKVTGVERISSAFKQAALNSAVGKQEALEAQAAPLDNVQGLLQEPSDIGLQNTMTEFYQAWTDLGNNPTVSTTNGAAAINGASAAVVIQDGASLAAGLKTLSDGVSAEFGNQYTNLTGIVEQVNASVLKIAELNQRIIQGTAGGDNVNALLDQRDTAITDIVRLTGATSINQSDGSVQVSVSGVTLVQGNAYNLMSVTGSSTLENAVDNPPGLLVGSVRANPAGGQAAGVLSALNTDLPRISETLDTVANGIRDAVNARHSAGYTLDGTPGGDFFTGEGAAGLTVAVTSADELAVSSVSGPSTDGSNARGIGRLVNPSVISEALGGATAPQSVYSGMVTQIGTQLQGLNTAIDSQTGIVATAQSAVDSESGVDLNEELTNMILFQRSFQANARVISAADEMLQSLIGMV
ncbi:flagellar hook-associated protein FlgK [Kineosporia sp. J2-2]|uniref:Flagellar hook-associated protein 1 n=1 Tax=Kineosporia corallincola TaxID=2835133 RepID=A0ABS5TK26_9ACTN|nr:flagellar hook-associated protein FlgK [Kineosporia corallincola]MBT0771426.1 flagellar hook-associated protein FlgK [Kineosporia corallincola]